MVEGKDQSKGEMSEKTGKKWGVSSLVISAARVAPDEPSPARGVMLPAAEVT